MIESRQPATVASREGQVHARDSDRARRGHGYGHGHERIADNGRRIGAVAGYRLIYASYRRSYVSRTSGRGSSRWSIRVIARIAVGRSGQTPLPTAPRIADPRTAVSSTAGTRTGNPVTSALIWFHSALRAGPPHARIAVTRTPASSIGRLTCRIASALASRIDRAR